MRIAKRRIKDRLYPDRYFISKQYFFRNGFYPDLKDPKTLSEKTQWLKLHDRSALHTICADKIRVRDYVEMQLGPAPLAKAILVTRDPADITPEKITAEKFVVKTNHDQGGVHLCRDRATFDWAAVRADLAERMRINKYYEFREHQYKAIRPGILVEEFLEGEAGANVHELKIYCFHGQPKFIQVVLDRFENRLECFYDPEWKRMAHHAPVAQLERDLPKPPCLERLLRDAATLAAPFLFCRIDFLFGGGDKAWFGEVTFHHGAGLIRFEPLEFERVFGDMLDLKRLPETRRMQDEIAARLNASGGAR